MRYWFFFESLILTYPMGRRLCCLWAFQDWLEERLWCLIMILSLSACYVPDYFGGLVLEEIVEVEPWFSDFFVGCRARGDSVN